MTFGRRFRRLVGMPTRTDVAIDRDLDDKVSFHLEMRVKDLVSLGRPEPEARQQDRNAQRDRRIA